MKFKIDKDVFFNVLNVLPVVQTNITPILNTVHIESQNGHLICTSTDQIISTVAIAEAEVVEEGKMCVATKGLLSLIRDLPAGPVEVSMLKTKVVVKSGKVKIKLNSYVVEEYPLPKPVEGELVATLDTQDLERMLTLTTICLGVSIGFNVNGALFEVEDGKLSIVATDGKRLAYIKNTNNPAKVFIVPYKAIVELKKIISGQDDTVKITVSDKKVSFNTSTVTLSSCLIEDKYPDYNKFIPAQTDNVVTVNRLELLLALKRANLLKQTNVTDDPVKMVFSGKQLVVSKHNENIGEIEETVAIEYNGEDIAIGFNPKYLIDILEIYDIIDSNKLEIEITTGAKQRVVFRKDNYVYLALPILL